jgi:hypothetical protein
VCVCVFTLCQKSDFGGLPSSRLLANLAVRGLNSVCVCVCVCVCVWVCVCVCGCVCVCVWGEREKKERERGVVGVW